MSTISRSPAKSDKSATFATTLGLKFLYLPHGPLLTPSTKSRTSQDTVVGCQAMDKSPQDCWGAGWHSSITRLDFVAISQDPITNFVMVITRFA
jgi:hypothetical protein